MFYSILFWDFYSYRFYFWRAIYIGMEESGWLCQVHDSNGMTDIVHIVHMYYRMYMYTYNEERQESQDSEGIRGLA